LFNLFAFLKCTQFFSQERKVNWEKSIFYALYICGLKRAIHRNLLTRTSSSISECDIFMNGGSKFDNIDPNYLSLTHRVTEYVFREVNNE